MRSPAKSDPLRPRLTQPVFFFAAAAIVAPPLLFVPVAWPNTLYAFKDLLLQLLLSLFGAAFVLDLVLNRTKSGVALGPKEKVLILFSASLVLSMLQVHNPLSSLQPLICWFGGILLYYFAPRILNSEQRLQTITLWLVFAGVLSAISGLGCLFKPTGADQILCSSLLRDKNITAQFLILPLFLSAFCFRTERGLNRAAFGAAIFAIAFYIIGSQSRGVWLGVIGGMLFLGWRKLLDLQTSSRQKISVKRQSFRSRILICSIAFIAVIAIAELLLRSSGRPSLLTTVTTLAHPFSGSAGGRLRIWINSSLLIREHLFTGVGIGNWNEVYPLYANKIVPDPQDSGPFNSPLELLGEVGLFGFLLFSLTLFLQFRSRESWNGAVEAKAALAGILIASCFHVPLQVGLLLFGSLWAALALSRGPEGGEPAATRPAGSAIAAALVACFSILAAATALPIFKAKIYAQVISRYVTYEQSQFVFQSNMSIAPGFQQDHQRFPGFFSELDYRANHQAVSELAKWGSGDWRSQNLGSIIAGLEIDLKNWPEAEYWLRVSQQKSPNDPENLKMECLIANQLTFSGGADYCR